MHTAIVYAALLIVPPQTRHPPKPHSQLAEQNREMRIQLYQFRLEDTLGILCDAWFPREPIKVYSRMMGKDVIEVSIALKAYPTDRTVVGNVLFHTNADVFHEAARLFWKMVGSPKR